MAETGAPTQTPSAGLPPRRRRWPWILLAGILALGLCLRALLPLAVERAVAWGSRRYVGLPARVDNVDFSLLRGGITIEGLTVGPRPDGVTPLRAAWRPPPLSSRDALLHWDRVSVRFSWIALLHHTLHLKDVTVEAPEARLTRELDGSIDPLRHAHPSVPRTQPAKTSAPAAPASSPPSRPWKIQVDRFALQKPEIHLVDAATGVDLIRFSLEDFGLQKVSRVGRNLSLGGVSIRGPVLSMRRDLIFGRKPARKVPQPTTAGAGGPPAGRAAAPSYRIGSIDIERARFVWITDAGPVPVALSVHASDVTAQPGQRFPIDVQLEIQNGKIEVRGRAGVVPPAYAGSLTWTQLPLPPLVLAAEPKMAPWLRSCSSSGSLQLDMDLGAKGRPDLLVSGRTSLDKLQIADPSGKQVSLAWKRLAIQIGRIAITLPRSGGAPASTRVALKSLELLDPQIHYTRPAPALDALLGGSEKTPPGGGSPAQTAPTSARVSRPTPVELSLASLELKNGNLELLDKTVKPQAATRIRGLSVSARDLRYPAIAAQGVRLRATLPQHAPLSVEGRGRSGDADIALAVRRLDLPSFDPYAAAAGATLDHGQASVQTTLRLRGDRIETRTQLLLTKLGISLRNPESFQERFGVPIDLALALLRDPAGDIRLSIPVTMKRKEARVGLGSIVVSALRQALIGALSAPLKMAGAALSGLTGGGGGVSIDPILAVPGTSAIPEDASDRIDGIAQLLISRPALGLELRGRTGPADRPGLAEQILIARMNVGKGLPDVKGAGFFARRRLRSALEKRAKGKRPDLSQGDQALYDKMLSEVQVPDGRFRALARQRADAVRALLIARPGIQASHVTSGPAAAAGAPAVVLHFEAE